MPRRKPVGTGSRSRKKSFQTDDPNEVVRRYREDTTTVDLVITDLMMPRMNGLTLVDTISGLVPELRVVYMSGYMHGEVSWAGLPGSGSG